MKKIETHMVNILGFVFSRQELAALITELALLVFHERHLKRHLWRIAPSITGQRQRHWLAIETALRQQIVSLMKLLHAMLLEFVLVSDTLC